MSSELIQCFKVFCVTEDTYVPIWSKTTPTECPNNSTHTIGIIKSAGPLGLQRKVAYCHMNSALDIASPLAVAIATADTYVKITGASLVDNNEIEHTASVCTVKTEGLYEVELSMSGRIPTASGAIDVKFALGINGTASNATASVVSMGATSWVSCNTNSVLSLQADDTLEVMIANVADTKDIDLASLHLTIRLIADRTI